MKPILLGLLLTIVGFLSYLAYHLGYFRPVIVGEATEGPFDLLVKPHRGAYYKIVPVIESVESWAKAHGLSCSKSFGQYLDDPSLVEESRQRSRGGCLLSTEEAQKARTLAKEFPAEVTLDTLPRGFFVKGEFQGSPGIGPFRVYPRLLEYMDAHHYQPTTSWGVLEVYEVRGPREMTTTYYFPVQKK